MNKKLIWIYWIEKVDPLRIYFKVAAYSQIYITIKCIACLQVLEYHPSVIDNWLLKLGNLQSVVLLGTDTAK